jgi:hypothetical protein
MHLGGKSGSALEVDTQSRSNEAKSQKYCFVYQKEEERGKMCLNNGLVDSINQSNHGHVFNLEEYFLKGQESRLHPKRKD